MADVQLSTRSAAVKTAYEANANTNAFTDAEKTKVADSITNITGLITQGTNVTITGSGTSGSPYQVSAAGGAPAFNTVTSGTNTAAAMVVGTGASLAVSGTGTITATTLATPRTIGGVSFDGSANIVPQTIQVVDAASDTTTFVMLAGSATGNLQPLTDAGLAYNASTNVLTAGGFSGPLTGNVTGNVTGSSGSTTGNAATATALQTARTINGTSFNGTANIVITPRVGTTASSSTPTPDADTQDLYTVTALAAGATFGAPTGTPVNGQALVIRVKDNGTARSLAYNAIYRAVGVTLPTTTVISKTLYLGMIYNSADTRWDVLLVSREA